MLVEENRKNLTKDKMNLEMQLIINKRLHERNIIDNVTYETISNEILRELQKVSQTA